MAGLDLVTEDILEYASVEEITTIVPNDLFYNTPNSRTLFYKRSTCSFPNSNLLNIPNKDVLLTGPFYFYPHIGEVPSGFATTTTSPDLYLTRISDVTCAPGQLAMLLP